MCQIEIDVGKYRVTSVVPLIVQCKIQLTSLEWNLTKKCGLTYFMKTWPENQISNAFYTDILPRKQDDATEYLVIITFSHIDADQE